MSKIVMLTAFENESFRNMNMDDVTEIDDGQFKELIKSFAELEDKIAKLEKVAEAASEVLASDGFHYLGELRDALKELGEK